MRKSITSCTQTKLQEYHQELKQREERERKDNIALWTLAVAGLMGVVILILSGMRHDHISDNTRTVIDPQSTHIIKHH